LTCFGLKARSQWLKEWIIVYSQNFFNRLTWNIMYYKFCICIRIIIVFTIVIFPHPTKEFALPLKDILLSIFHHCSSAVVSYSCQYKPVCLSDYSALCLSIYLSTHDIICIIKCQCNIRCCDTKHQLEQKVKSLNDIFWIYPLLQKKTTIYWFNGYFNEECRIMQHRYRALVASSAIFAPRDWRLKSFWK